MLHIHNTFNTRDLAFRFSCAWVVCLQYCDLWLVNRSTNFGFSLVPSSILINFDCIICNLRMLTFIYSFLIILFSFLAIIMRMNVWKFDNFNVVFQCMFIFYKYLRFSFSPPQFKTLLIYLFLFPFKSKRVFFF